MRKRFVAYWLVVGVCAAATIVPGESRGQVPKSIQFGAATTDADVAAVQAYSGPAAVTVNQATKLTAAGWKSLAEKYPGMTYLQARSGSLDDVALRSFADLSKLEELSIDDNDVGDAGLAALDRLSSLKLLSVGNTKITDAGLAPHLAKQALFYLDVSGTACGDATVKRLCESTTVKLTTLHLSNCRISDVAGGDLAKLTTLKHLFLQNTQITDASIPALGKLTSLKLLNVNGTKLTPQGIVMLQQLLPRTAILTVGG